MEIKQECPGGWLIDYILKWEFAHARSRYSVGNESHFAYVLPGTEYEAAYMSFSLDDKRYLLAIARHAVADATQSKKQAHREPIPENLDYNTGVFVTLWQGKELRGCIGYIEALAPLVSTIREVSEKAALEDPRFAPVTWNDLASLDIEISVLYPKKKISSIAEIEIGTHGLIVATDRRRGLLLPQVPLEYGWDSMTFVAQTCRKAGLPADAWTSPQVELFTFTAEVFRESEFTPA